jgi:hypothetical protein
MRWGSQSDSPIAAQSISDDLTPWLPVLHNLHRTVVVTVVAVRMMQVAIDQVVNVITVRDRFVAAVGAMNVTGIMLATVVRRGAIRRVSRTHRDSVLFDNAVIPHAVQMAIMQVVGVILMLDRSMPATRAMNVIVIVVCVVCHIDLQV